jgi:hypothetical protein
MSVAIGDSDIVNLTGRPQNVMANFIIDGGKFGLAYAPGATIEYDLRLDRDKATVFESSGELESYYSGPFNVTNFTSSGEDIGAVLDPLTATVDIPLSFQSVDLGVLLPNQSMQLLYVMEIFADVPSYAEYAVMEFEDPFSVSGSPVEPGILRPMVEFSEYDGPPLSNVPVPPAMLLFASALMVMLFGGRIGRSAA